MAVTDVFMLMTIIIHIKGEVNLDRKGVASPAVKEESFNYTRESIGDIPDCNIVHLEVAAESVDNMWGHYARL